MANNDRERADEEFENAAKRMFGMVEKSAVFMALMPDEPDTKICIELGAAIYYEKPIIVVAPPGRKVPRTVRRIADAVLEDFDFDSEEDRDRLANSVVQTVAKLGDG
jgi:hypothetical protein